jgi:GNAT superfamily N-acetyltransferase
MRPESGPEVIFHTEPAVFAERVQGLIRRDPVGCNVLATNLAVALSQGPPPGSLWIVVHANDRDTGSDDAGVVLAGMTTPPFPLWLTPILAAEGPGSDPGRAQLAEKAVAALAQRLVTDPAGPGPALRGVNGTVGSAQPFAEAWLRVTGRRSVVRMRQRMYQLTELIEPDAVPGAARTATGRDLNLCVDWMHAFHDEAVPHHPAGDLRRIVDRRIRGGGLSLWENGGQPTAMAGTSTMIGGVARIGPVYTPRARRRQGYGAAVTAAATRAGFAAGADRCMLFTDLANPTSNAVYQRLGYRPVGDAVSYAFTG